MEDVGVDGEAGEEQGCGQDEGAEERGEEDGHEEAVEEPVVGGGLVVFAEGLGDEGVEREEDAAYAEGEGVEEDLGEGAGGEGEGGAGRAAEHGCVDDGHRDPA